MAGSLRPAEPAQCKGKRNPSPQNQYQDPATLRSQRCAFKNRGSQRIIEWGQGQGFAERLQYRWKAFAGEKQRPQSRAEAPPPRPSTTSGCQEGQEENLPAAWEWRQTA